MKVLLISANTEQINMPVLPLGMACITAAVERAGHDVKAVNLMTRNNTREFLKESICNFNPDIIGISVRNIDDQVMEQTKFMLEPVKHVVSQCREFSKSPLVLGGAGYSIFPESSLAYLGADMGIQGEGEKAFIMLLERLEKKLPVSDVPGLFLAEKGLQANPGFIKKLDDFPMPLPNIHLELPSALEDQEIWLPFQTRRGCPMNCSYCSTAVIEGRILRKRSPERAVENLAEYVKAGFKHFFFVDNTFNLPPSYAEALCDEIIKKGIKIKWRGIFYPRKTDEKLVKKMADAGCVEVSLGFESGSRKILENMNKKFTPQDIIQVSKQLKSYGIAQMGFLLLGGPDETRDTVEKSFSFADNLNLESMRITAGIRIYPYTTLSGIAKSEGRIKSDSELLFPHFYIKKGMEEWLQETAETWLKKKPNWIM